MPGPAWRLVPASLTGRLVATVVLMVALVAVLVSAATTAAMNAYLSQRLDRQVDGALDRAVHVLRGDVESLPPDGPDPDRDRDGGPRGFGDARGQGAGTLTALVTTSSRTDPGVGVVLTDRGGRREVSGAALAALAEVHADGHGHVLDLPGLGGYRVKALRTADGTLVAGLSTAEITGTLARLVGIEALLVLAGVSLSALAGRWLVRRQLRPLHDVAATAHEVAALPLASGEIGTTVRVRDDLTDERTEVGAVGSALNTLLAHVEHALDERHRSEQQVRRFVADASHELRTPLTTIHGYAELVRRTDPPDPAQLSRAMAKVEGEATRMSHLVEDLLLLARLDAGRPLARDDVDLTRLVLEAVGDARVVGPDHRWLLDLPDEPVVVPGDEQRLHQVVTNLLNNARRHTPAGTTVTAVVREESRDVVLAVQDDGPGMPPELTRTAFERFSRGDSSRTRESGGAGLGLSLVRAIAAAHGGSASVSSEPGRTRFEVRLPASAMQAAQAPART